MLRIVDRASSKRGEIGIRIQLYDSNTNETASLVVHGVEIRELHKKILFWLRAEMAAGSSSIEVIINPEEKIHGTASD